MAISTIPLKKREYGKNENVNIEDQIAMYATQDCKNLNEIFQQCDKNAHIVYQNGYFYIDSYFTSVPMVKIQREKYIDLSSGAKKVLDKLCSKYDGKTLDTTMLDCLYDDVMRKHPLKKAIAQEILASQYKIHLMPKPEYILASITMILEACQQSSELKSLIYGLKVCPQPGSKDELDQLYATIVIYPVLGHENAQILLNRLCELFSPYCAEIGNSQVPRYNIQVNPLICYSQGDGDFKNKWLREFSICKFYTLFKDNGKLFAWGKKLEISDQKMSIEIRNAAQKEKDRLQNFTKMIITHFKCLREATNPLILLPPVVVVDVCLSSKIPDVSHHSIPKTVTTENSDEVLWHDDVKISI